MKDKLQQLMKTEGLSASRLAEILEIQPAGVSHLLAGRNKPSFDLLQKILRRFPKINPDWLLLDDGQMFRTETYNGEGRPQSPTDGNLFSDKTAANTERSMGRTEQSANRNMRTSQEGNISSEEYDSRERLKSQEASRIERVVVFYTDGSFSDYKPR